MSKRIDELPVASDPQVADPTFLWIIGDPANGFLYRVTKAQLATAFAGINPLTYVADGSEGDTITDAALAGKTILSIAREGGTLYKVASSPDPAEYTWDGTDIVLGTPISYAGERFLIIYV